ncbi:MAG: DUF2877 domain-containing protein [Arenicellales bacterium]|nr:DUF2877 domain-containing protein [Arenicellales bacterium]
MQSRLVPFDLRAVNCGQFAHELLQDGRNGRIAAVFEKAFYIRSGDGVACIGTSALLSSPISVSIDTCRMTDWRPSELRVGVPWHVSDSNIVFGHNVRIYLEGVNVWRPHQPLRKRYNRGLNHTMTAFYRVVKKRASNKGLGMFIVQPSLPEDQRLFTLVREPIEQLRRWLVTTMCRDSAGSPKTLQSVRPLLGLGPGLTPSGDDFLVGVMIALHAYGHEDMANEMWLNMRPWAVQLGNCISLAHLDAASKGLGFAPIHDFINALQRDDSSKMLAHLDSIDNIGHTSGWDTLAGVLTAVDVIKDKIVGNPPSGRLLR